LYPLFHTSTAVGVASPRAHGQAITYTQRSILLPVEVGLVYKL
jgi:hypothetical protein